MQTVFEDDDRVFDSICAGASGYILKNFLNTKLVDSIKELQYGGSPMCPSIARKVLTKMQHSGACQTRRSTRLSFNHKRKRSAGLHGKRVKL